jgi:hypothetical protein
MNLSKVNLIIIKLKWMKQISRELHDMVGILNVIYYPDYMRFFLCKELQMQLNKYLSSCKHSNKFVIQKTFDEVKNLTFRYNTSIIRE